MSFQKLKFHGWGDDVNTAISYSSSRLIPWRSTNMTRLKIGRHLITRPTHDGRSAGMNSTKYIATVLKNGTNFGPTLFSWKKQSIFKSRTRLTQTYKHACVLVSEKSMNELFLLPPNNSSPNRFTIKTNLLMIYSEICSNFNNVGVARRGAVPNGRRMRLYNCRER